MDYLTALIGPRHVLHVKRSRGEAHYAHLREAIEPFIESDAHRVSTKLDLENGTAEALSDIIDLHRAAQWALLIGDAVHNYMGTLDHLTYQLALLESDPPKCKPQFPIFPTREKFDKSGAQGRRLGCLHQDDQDTIIAMQPFSERPDDPESHPLMRLYRLEMQDKHDLLLATAVAGFVMLTETPTDLEIVTKEPFPAHDALKRHSVLARYEIRQTGPNPKLEIEAKGAFAVEFADGAACAGLPVLGTLDEIRHAIARTIAQFDDRFPVPMSPPEGWGYVLADESAE